MPRFFGNPESRFPLLGSFFVVLILAATALVVFWSADRRPPIEGLVGKFAGWDPKNPNIGWVQWTGVRRRSCDGTSYRQLVDIVTGAVIEIDPIHYYYNGIVADDSNGVTGWRVHFEKPEWFRHEAVYRVRTEYICNPIHALWPLVVTPADIPILPPGAEER